MASPLPTVHGGILTQPDAWEGLAFQLRCVTEGGARSASEWSGRGAPDQADAAVASTMRALLDKVPAGGVVVCGEGEKDGVAHLSRHERFGVGDAPVQLDLAVDPIDGTTRLGMGLGGAISVLAVCPRGTMFDPGPAYYMEKLVAGPAAAGKLDPEAGTAERLRELAKALGKGLRELTVFVLDKPRHADLVKEIRETGAKVAVHPSGDVEGVLRAVLTGTGIDALMGTGGTPEGLIAACAVRALGGVFYGRLDPQKPYEADRVQQEGLSTERWMSVSELVQSERQIFAASGITTGALLKGVAQGSGSVHTLLVVGHGEGRARQHMIESRVYGHD